MESSKRFLGNCKDIIKLSTKKIVFNKQENFKEITTEGKWWWIADVFYIDNLNDSLDKIHLAINTNSISGYFFKIEKTSDNSLYIHLDKNTSNKKREITIVLEAGDYFDYVLIYQDK